MALAHLFPRCPVLPVDGALSLARYLHSVEQTRAEAGRLERAGGADAERAALLHLRVVQLVAKTLPAHPDRALPASAPVLARLDAAAHASLDAVERLARAIAGPAAPAGPDPAPPPPRRERGAELRVPAALLDVFANMMRERAAGGLRGVGVLAARADAPARVAALVVPAQRDAGAGAAADASPVRYEDEVRALAQHKGLVPLGVVVHAPGAARPLVRAAERIFCARVAGGPGVAVVVAPDADERVASFDVSDADARPAKGVVFVEDALEFKLYDLRPLAKMKDEQAADAAAGAKY